MRSKTDLVKDRATLENRAKASLVGHAVGDSFGDIARSPDYHLQYGITMDFTEKPAPGTDDTEFALLTAQTLIKAGGNLTDADVLESWRTHVLPLSELKRGGASEREAAAGISDAGSFHHIRHIQFALYERWCCNEGDPHWYRLCG